MSPSALQLPDESSDEADHKRIEIVSSQIDVRLRSLHKTPTEFFGDVIRRAIDEVLSLGTKRRTINDLDSVEKTYIGTRVEVLVRDGLDFGRGTNADALVNGIEVDIKWSKSLSWMIGPENLGTVCLGIGTTNETSLFSVGLFVPREEYANPGRNRDRKLSLPRAFYERRVLWLVMRGELKRSFIETVPRDLHDEIMRQPSAQARLRRLAELFPMIAIPRAAIVYVALNKDDPMRRIREDKGRSDPPLGKMIALSAKYDRSILLELGLEPKRDHFFFVERAKLPVRSSRRKITGDGR